MLDWWVCFMVLVCFQINSSWNLAWNKLYSSKSESLEIVILYPPKVCEMFVAIVQSSVQVHQEGIWIIWKFIPDISAKVNSYCYKYSQPHGSSASQVSQVLCTDPLQLCSANLAMGSSLLPSVSSISPIWSWLLEPFRLNQHYLLFCKFTYSISSGLVTTVIKYYPVSHWSLTISSIPLIPLYDNKFLNSRYLNMHIQSLFKI